MPFIWGFRKTPKNRKRADILNNWGVGTYYGSGYRPGYKSRAERGTYRAATDSGSYGRRSVRRSMAHRFL